MLNLPEDQGTFTHGEITEAGNIINKRGSSQNCSSALIGSVSIALLPHTDL
jgi:hypothetical protein